MSDRTSRLVEELELSAFALLHATGSTLYLIFMRLVVALVKLIRVMVRYATYLNRKLR